MSRSANVLLFGPSRAGKSFLTAAFRRRGLPAFDIEKEPGIIGWRNDSDGRPVTSKPNPATKEWLATHHFLMHKLAMAAFLQKNPGSIILAHSWNIMDCLDLFDETYFMYLPPEEIERRMGFVRADHDWQGSPAEVEFMKSRHEVRRQEAAARDIPHLDVSGTADEIYAAFCRLRAQAAA